MATPPHSLAMITAEATITCWRGDISATEFTLTVVSTATLQERSFQGLRDETPDALVITLTPTSAEWSSLPIGEYTYEIVADNKVVAMGLLKLDRETIRTTEYDQSIEYVEYTE